MISSFFASASISTLGSFQDGGLRYNNPASLAVCEARQVWSPETNPDIVLSLGTGSGEDCKSPKVSHFRNFVADGFISRLVRLLAHSFNREGPWKEMINRLDESKKKDYIRLNIPISPTKSVRLDDISKMDELRAAVHRQPNSKPACEDTAWTLLLSNFYFLLDSRPTYHDGIYHCQGSLRCRMNARKIFEAMSRFQRTVKIATDNVSFGQLTDEDICPSCHRYRRPISLRVRALDDVVTIMLKTGSDQRHISGGGRSIGWYMQQQGLDSVFGRADHGSPGQIVCLKCDVRRPMRPKRKISASRSNEARKKARFV